jgi:hypothetical protein
VSETRRTHWQRVYTDKAPTDISWYQPVPEISLHLTRETGIERAEPVLDAGGGASTLVDHLHADGYTDITVMDTSGKVLERSSREDTWYWRRLGRRVRKVVAGWKSDATESSSCRSCSAAGSS